MHEDIWGVISNFKSALKHSDADQFMQSDGTGGKLNEKKPKGQGKKAAKKWKKTR